MGNELDMNTSLKLSWTTWNAGVGHVQCVGLDFNVGFMNSVLYTAVIDENIFCFANTSHKYLFVADGRSCWTIQLVIFEWFIPYFKDIWNQPEVFFPLWQCV